VTIRAHDFGGLNGVAALDPSEPYLTATYQPLIKALKKIGYEERLTLWGAPYDWRLAADGLVQRGVADAMQALIELASASAGGEQVVVVAHSMVRCSVHCTCLFSRAMHMAENGRASVEAVNCALLTPSSYTAVALLPSNS
jgi:Lecithin:cholesterol acyltransferase